MSLFNMGLNSLEVSEERMMMAQLEFESLSALFESLLTTCKSKCVPPRYGEEDLNKGEMECIDRCVSKYFKTNLKVGEFMRSKGHGPDSMAGFEASLSAIGSGAISKKD
ncbi:mitochondrial import inner membrane translocase subunit Tim12p [Trichomonascus vanleenenianus]|uniref:Tim12p n=1 Tax=Trichomonascus vanleenenianus TaxID=2268995 RepID=UPI003ECB11C1